MTASRSGRAEQLVEEALPALLERHGRRRLVVDPQPGGSPASTACADEDALGEAVQRGDGGLVDLVEGHRQARPDLGGEGGVDGALLEGGADALAQLGGGGLGEGDGGELAQPGGAAADEPDDAGDEGGGLAGAGARLDEQRGVEVVGDAVAHGLVGEGGGHAGTSEVAG